MRHHNRIALVAGAAMGIGKATARLFAQHGARVLAVDINHQAGTETEREIPASGADSSVPALSRLPRAP